MVVLIAGGALYACAPALAAWWLRGQLPWRTAFTGGGLVVASVSTAAPVPAVPAPELQLLVPAARATAVASAASGWWLPPGLARSGQHAEGSLILPVLRVQPFSWQALVGGSGESPLACLRVRSGDLDRFLAASAVTAFEIRDRQVFSCTYIVDAGRITDDDDPLVAGGRLERRQRVVARGSIVLDAVGFRRVVHVQRLAGHAITTFSPVPAGLRLACTIAIEESEADPISLPLLGDVRPLLLKQLELAANRGLADAFEQVILPAWFPTDARVDIEVLDAPDQAAPPRRAVDSGPL